jgi:endonuclease-3
LYFNAALIIVRNVNRDILADIGMNFPSAPRVRSVLRILEKRYQQKADMQMTTAEDTLIGVLLSARTTDVQVLKMFPRFRDIFPDWRSLADASAETIARQLTGIGLFRSKARALHGLAKRILEDYGGKIPRTMEELVSLPGVGRKTASCVLWYVFGIPAMAVDTHVFRISRRLGWAIQNTPEKVERELMDRVPKNAWGDVNRILVQFGRDLCRPGKPQCWRCPVARYCPYPHKTLQLSS